MKNYKTMEEVKADIKDNNLVINDDVTFEMKTLDIKEVSIKTGDINAGNIKAKKVEYYAVAFAYKNIKVQSIKGVREKARHFVLDGMLEVEDEKGQKK